MDTDEEDAVESLKSLGLSEYEAKVFIALQRLGVGTARDVYRLTDVPRSQVYGAAETLEERGLVEIQQSKPMEYRPVTLKEARERLQERFEKKQDVAFDYLEGARDESPRKDEEREDFWTVKGRDTIDSRIDDLLSQADDRVIFITTDGELVRSSMEDRLVSLADELDVYVMSSDEEFLQRFEDAEGIMCVKTPEKAVREDRGGRFIMVDSNTVLLTVLGDGELSDIRKETAVWSSETSFATVLVQITEGWLGEYITP
ncbi:MAG: helix-turn-helix domain-containing protein [Halobacteriales archaeon]|nr:helix-turn-helix domain-containing protein [Halobacteriales archaeon]